MNWILFLQLILLVIAVYLALYALIEQWFKMKTTNTLAEAQLKKDNYLN